MSGMIKYLIRFVVFVKHPQVFLPQYGQNHTQLQDLKPTAAGRLARVDVIENYDQQRNLTSKKDSVDFVRSAEVKVPEHIASYAVKAAKDCQAA